MPIFVAALLVAGAFIAGASIPVISQASTWPSGIPMPLASVVLGVVLAFVVAEFRERMNRQRNRDRHFDAIAAEVRMCGAIAAGYLRTNVLSPVYRLPLIGHQRSLPELLAEGSLTEADATALIEFYVDAMSFNLSLDYCHDARPKRDAAAGAGLQRGVVRSIVKVTKRARAELESEAGRSRLKAARIASGAKSGTRYAAALAAIGKHRPRPSLHQTLDFDGEEHDQDADSVSR